MKSLGKELVRAAGRVFAPRNDLPVPVVSSRGSMGALLGGGQNGSNPEAQMEAMGGIGTLFAIVDASAEGVAKVGWELYPAGLSETEREGKALKTHPALEVWNTPNPFTPRQELVETGQQHCELTGETWLVVARRGTSTVGPPVELWNVRPDRMTPVPDPQTFIAGYTYKTPDGDEIPLEITEVLMIRRPNPLDPYRGMAPIQAVMDDSDAIRYSAQWQRNFFVNSAEPGGLIEVPEILNDGDYEKLKTRWREQHRGVANAHRVAILEGGYKWVDRKYSIRDMMFTDLRELSSEKVREAYRFPKPMLGTVEDINRANADAAERVFGRWYIAGRLARWQQMLNREYLPLFPGGDRLEFHPVRSDYIPEDVELETTELNARVQAFAVLVDKGVPAEQALELAGLPAVDLPEISEDTIGRREKMELVQKVYLGVGTVITAVEARQELADAGWNINPDDWSDAEPEEVEPQPALPPPPGVSPQLEPVPDEDMPMDDTQAARWRAQARLLRAQEGAPPVPATESSIPGRAEVDAAAEHLVADWQTVLDSWLDQTVRTVETNGDNEQAIREATLPTTYAIDLLTERMHDQYADGADELYSQARAQGVDADDLEDVDVNNLSDLRDQAETVVGELARDFTDAALNAVRQAYEPVEDRYDDRPDGRGGWIRNVTNTEAAERVREMMADVQASRSRLTGSLHAGRNQGRIAQAAKAPKATYVAMEESDDASCEPCRDVDGTEFRNLKAAEKAYKSGGYSKCLGRDRCRGTFDARWD